MMAISASEASSVKHDLLTSVTVRFATWPGEGNKKRREYRMQSDEMSFHPASSFLPKTCIEKFPLVVLRTYRE